ncbi:MAG: type I phosphomannose isomerase catalytic subunit [Bacteroidales bacterium]
MKLYPFKFEPLLRPMIWGGNYICKFKEITPLEAGIGESWEISDFPETMSVISNGEMKGEGLHSLIKEYGESLLGKHVYERFGEKFPLLIKFIDASNDLSIQVHPDDKLAAERHDSFGKTEMWYVINAREGAGLYSGFSAQITPDEYVERVKMNTFMDVLERYEVKSGDIFFLPAGRVHAIGSGLFIAEIQQTSDITYRIYDYNRLDKEGNKRELHTELAKDAIDYEVLPDYQTHYTPEPNKAVEVADCKYFHTNLLELDKELDRPMKTYDSFVIYICTEGQGELKDASGNVTSVRKGETILVPAESADLKIIPSGKLNLLEVYIP